MNDFLTDILHMSLTGSIVIIVVLIARVLMRKFPKKYMYLLWGIVGFRLLCPIAFESRFSIFNIRPIRNSVDNVRNLPLIQYGSAHGTPVAEVSGHTAVKAAETATGTIEKINVMPFLLTLLWAAIAVGIVCAIVYKYIAIRHDLKNTKEIKPGMFVGNQVDTPFVMGIIKPKIYMPAGLTEAELEYLTLHEKTHIKRGDTFFKAVGLAALALHWFNPLVWIAYAMFVRDMEMSCDEAVIAKLGNDVKADYSMSLVSFAQRSNRSKYIVVPIAFSKMLFGRKDVKMRIKNVLGYHGTSKLISTMALVLVASIGLVCVFNATSRADESEDDDVTVVTEASDITGEAADTEEDVKVNVEGDQDVFPDETVIDDYGMEVDPEPGSEADSTVMNEDGGSKSKVRKQLEEFGQLANDPMPEEGPVTVNTPEDELVVDYEPEEVFTPATGASIKTTKDNIFKKELPVFDGVDVDVTLNLPKGTKVDDNPDLGRFMDPDATLESDVFSVYYKQGVDVKVFKKMVDTLTSKFGFTGIYPDGGESTGVQALNFVGSTKDGLNVTVEQFGNYLRISYYYLDSNETNSFARLG